MQLSPHFTLAELAHTEVRQYQAINLERAKGFEQTLRVLCDLLEKVRSLCGDRPIVVHSGFRSPALNTYIGGSKTSQHTKGEAADFHVVGISLPEVARLIVESGLRFGQLIVEDGDGDGVPTWIHLSLFVAGQHENEVLWFDGHKYHKYEP